MTHVKRVAIVLHEHERRLEDSNFTIEILRREWVRDGRAVDTVYGVPTSNDADLAVNHVDLTVTPEQYRRSLDRFPRAINGRLLDISKTTISRNLVTSDDDYRGMVIVKTDANAGGSRDLVLGARTSLAGRARWKLARTFPSRWRYFARGDYPIFDSKHDVPRRVWRNPALVVEQFQSERDRDGNFVLRAWSFLGSEHFDTRTLSPRPVAKGVGLIERAVQKAGPPAEIRAFRDQFAADYGRIDYAIVDGRPVVYDLNRTPTTTPAGYAAYHDELARLARGIADY